MSSSLSGIVFNTTFSDPTLPTRIPYDVSIGQHAGLLGWYVLDATRVTLSGSNLTAITDRSPAGANVSQATVGKQPVYNAAVAAVGGRPTMTFSSGEYINTPIVVPTGATGIHSQVLVGIPAANSVSGGYQLATAGQGSAPYRWLGTRGVGDWAARVVTTGSAVSGQLTSTTFTAGVAHLVIMTLDPTAATLKLSIDGAAPVVTTVTGLENDDPLMAIGGVYSNGADGAFGDVADLSVWNIDVLAVANASLLATIKQYTRDRYGLTVS